MVIKSMNPTTLELVCISTVLFVALVTTQAGQEHQHSAVVDFSLSLSLAVFPTVL